MESLHQVLRAIRTETKSGSKPLNVFREFLAHLDQAQRKPPRPRAKPHRRRVSKRAK
ncbi:MULTISPECIES: hypothetical protein [Rhodopseudomonas]|uniref:hypothetical protein n=1 Tax=Rhodopseudomonas TaxID=1073 RepID=UPI000AAD8DC7|nr:MULTISPECIES: hypothetical protein [Rhodopseudomonas]WOK19979.1 hypothetical protein RBJ75_10885 [Rhodopseudomonas sp. BAL398]